QALHPDRMLADGGFEEIAATVCPASYEGDTIIGVLGGTAVEDVVRVAGVGLHQLRAFLEAYPLATRRRRSEATSPCQRVANALKRVCRSGESNHLTLPPITSLQRKQQCSCASSMVLLFAYKN